MRQVLLTGFEPFADHKVNPSQQIAEQLNGQSIAGARVASLVLPVIFGEDTRRVLPAIDQLEPALVLCLGLAAGTTHVDVEMFAINHRKADGGNGLAPIVEGGPAAYFATIDASQVAAAIERESGAPARRHGYAGSYLCNHVFYQCLHHAATHRPSLPVGFIHLPLSTDQIEAGDGRSALDLDLMAAGARAAIEEALR